MESSKQCQRVVIQFLTAGNMSASKISNEKTSKNVYGTDVCHSDRYSDGVRIFVMESGNCLSGQAHVV